MIIGDPIPCACGSVVINLLKTDETNKWVYVCFQCNRKSRIYPRQEWALASWCTMTERELAKCFKCETEYPVAMLMEMKGPLQNYKVSRMCGPCYNEIHANERAAHCENCQTYTENLAVYHNSKFTQAWLLCEKCAEEMNCHFMERGKRND